MPNYKPVPPSTPDHYFNLCLTRSATALEMKTAFRRLALLHHPDKKAAGEKFDAADFRRIHDAYTVLRDASTRLAYDLAYPQLRAQWANYRSVYTLYLQRERDDRIVAEVERKRREQDHTDRLRRAGDRARAEMDRARRQEKEKLAEQRSRVAIQRAQREREQAAIELLRQLIEAEEQARLAHEEEARALREQREKEAHTRSAKVAEQARAEQSKRALKQLRQLAADLKAREEATVAAKASRYRRLFDEQRQAEALAKEKKTTNAAMAKAQRVQIARFWVSEKHPHHAESPQASQSRLLDGEYVQLGWQEKQGTETQITVICDFCNETLRLYYYQCPLGEAIACGNCMNRLSIFSPLARI